MAGDACFPRSQARGLPKVAMCADAPLRRRCVRGGRKTAKAMTSRRPEEAVRSGVVAGEDVLGSPGPAVLLGHGDGAGSPALPQLCSAAASVLAVLLAVLPPPVAARAVRVVCWCQYVLYQPS